MSKIYHLKDKKIQIFFLKSLNLNSIIKVLLDSILKETMDNFYTFILEFLSLYLIDILLCK
jgi:hypothetical protein